MQQMAMQQQMGGMPGPRSGSRQPLKPLILSLKPEALWPGTLRCRGKATKGSRWGLSSPSVIGSAAWAARFRKARSASQQEFWLPPLHASSETAPGSAPESQGPMRLHGTFVEVVFQCEICRAPRSRNQGAPNRRDEPILMTKVIAADAAADATAAVALGQLDP